MSEISQEALAAACAEKVRQLEFSVKQSAFDSVRQELETELAIARVALLALRERAEPVAYMIGGHYLMHANDPKVDNYSSAVPLYTAPPAPVVTAETFEEWSRRCEIQLTLCRPEFREVAEITWNACRAAMLAAPPAPVTAGWIACSERMPEVGDIVLTADNGGVNVGEMEHSGASYRYFTSVVSGRELPATHWMPLPEAPTKN
ncbi:DUF551 domain-containing protein [Cronobacter sakazakii]|uniref:DUF551 domain-containing protein n=1 Tax=Cronobacter sakazakii TaxID=28141 RepID=UPI001F2C1CFA|nr:DUF551 domain-containing protein [Cronobacter sakazakii]